MTRSPNGRRITPALLLLALALAAGAGSASAATPGRLAASASRDSLVRFWHIPVWAFPGSIRDSTVFGLNADGTTCGYQLKLSGSDTIANRPSTVTVRWLRNRRAEARPDFGGYRIYRVVNSPDTTSMVLIRRFSIQPSDQGFLWHFSRVDTAGSLQFLCGTTIANDSIVSFVDPDSNGRFEKVCRKVNRFNQCISAGDSVWALIAPPGPHDGFRTWYAVTYEAFNTQANTFEDLFVPDTTDNYARCDSAGVPGTCPNLNNKLANIISQPVVPAAASSPNLQQVWVVPNPFRGQEAWDQPGGHQVQFKGLPDDARIRIYTVTGELVRELHHGGKTAQPDLEGGFCLNCETWDLKNADGRDVASGIYVYRVTAGPFTAQNRFIIIR